MSPLPAGPPKPSQIGVPLATVEMPDSCQPLRTPFAKPLPPSLIGSGRNAFHERLNTWVRSSWRTP